ncbi:helix-turn-helix domain-containing protein [Paracoccus sp. KR1-242]|uniref:helix-turn-helix domain-containing protein n=1 Tax=Paracoccus sp. KR1-242 TaxID=3410028 RepID=UPI003C113C23
MSDAAPAAAGQWQHLAIERIDQLSDAVKGAGLDAVQMNNGPFRGSLVFHEGGGIVLSSGRVEGTVSLRGALSENKITVGVVLNAAPGSWHWLKEIRTGSVGVFRAGDLHDSFYGSGSTYVAATLDLEKLEEFAAESEQVLDNETLGGSRLHERYMEATALRVLGNRFARIHETGVATADGEALVDLLLRSLVAHFARAARQVTGGRPSEKHAVIVGRARAYIHANLQAPIRIDDLVRASLTSRRTLFRAFDEILGEPPQNYVRRLRLHRIRHDLASEREALCTIALIGSQWGIEEPSRLASWYRELFGELPSQTVARQKLAGG